MPLHQHSGHLRLQTAGDCSQITGDCNQTPVTANQRHWWQLSWLEMRAMPQRVMSAAVTYTGPYYSNVSFSTLACSSFLGIICHMLKKAAGNFSMLQMWRMWKVACNAKPSFFPAESADGGWVDKAFNIQALSFMFEIVFNVITQQIFIRCFAALVVALFILLIY